MCYLFINVPHSVVIYLFINFYIISKKEIMLDLIPLPYPVVKSKYLQVIYACLILIPI